MNPSGLVEHLQFWVERSPVLDRYRDNARGASHVVWRPRAIEVRSYAVLTGPDHPSSDEAWQEALRNGMTGAPVVFDAKPHTILDRWFATRLCPGLVRPRITIVALH